MLNVSGTMLIVRRREHGTGGPTYVRGNKSNAESSDSKGYTRTARSVYIPYGEPCMMLDFGVTDTTIPHGGKYKTLKLLWRNDYVDVNLTDKQANAWFTFFPTWNKRGHRVRFEGFKADGSLDKLYQSIGLKTTWHATFSLTK